MRLLNPRPQFFKMAFWASSKWKLFKTTLLLAGQKIHNFFNLVWKILIGIFPKSSYCIYYRYILCGEETKTQSLPVCSRSSWETHVLVFSATDLSFNTYLAISSIRDAIAFSTKLTDDPSKGKTTSLIRRCLFHRYILNYNAVFYLYLPFSHDGMCQINFKYQCKTFVTNITFKLFLSLLWKKFGFFPSWALAMIDT